MDTTDTEIAAIKVPVVSCKTALFCLDRVCGPDGMRVRDAAMVAVDSMEESVLPLDRLIAIAATSGLQLRAANFDWRGLLIAASTKAVLLLLKNGNVVAVLGTGREGIEEVTVSDPLYQDGEPFFLPRVALEHAWGGEALIVKEKRGKRERALAWYFSVLSICGLAAGLLLLFQAAIEVTVAGSHAPYSERLSAVSSNRSAASVAPDEAGSSAAATETGLRPNAPNADDALTSGGVTQADPAPPPTLSAEAGTAEPARETQTTEQPTAELQKTLEVAAIEASTDARKVPAAREENTARPPKARAGEAPEPASRPAAAPSTQSIDHSAAKSAPSVSADEIRALLVRGDSLIAKGDVASARLFYERAAEAGDGQAALRLGESYDPAFLARARLSGVRGDALAAARWYRRAHELGTTEAETLLRTMEPGKDQRLP
jgi:hypothetical protein